MVSRARDFVDSLLHSRRRRAAQRRLENSNPRSLLFLCHGNICRSPFAAAVFAQLLPPTLAGAVTTASAGFIGPGRFAPTYALDVARKFGVDLSSHRSSVLTSESLQAADLVIVMSSAQESGISARAAPGSIVLVLGDLDPLPVRRRTILDPWDGPVDTFDESYKRIDRCVRELFRIVWGAR